MGQRGILEMGNRVDGIDNQDVASGRSNVTLIDREGDKFTVQEVEPRILKAIKSIACFSDEDIRAVVHALMDRMKKPAGLYHKAVDHSVEAMHDNGACIKLKKTTLASMLKNKVTAKDRIAQSLLISLSN